MTVSNKRIIEVVDQAINMLVKEKTRLIELKLDDCVVVLDVSKRQINIDVYSVKNNPLFPLPMIDSELAMVKYDLRNKQYVRELNSEILKDSVIRILALYRTQKLNLDT